MPRQNLIAIFAATAVVALVAAGCSSSGSKSATGGGSANSATSGSVVKIGVMADLTGVGSSSYKSTEPAVKAYVQGYNKSPINGKTIQYVIRDTTSTAPGALTAAEALVQSDKVFAILVSSAYFFGAEPYLLKAGVPVVGPGSDGPEWNVKANSNLFDVFGTTNYKGLNTSTGDYMKLRGVTSCGSIGYGDSISSKVAAEGIVSSCKAVGLKGGYLNDHLAFGTTDMAPVAIAIKNAGVDGMFLPVVPSTAFALVAALKQQGVKLKSLLLAVGYGADLLSSSSNIASAQGDEFASVGTPIEQKTPATEKFAADLAAVGINSTPTFAQQEAYIGMTAFATGIKAAGANLTRDSFMTALRGVHDFNAGGLESPGSVDFSNLNQFGEGTSAAGCIFGAQLEGNKFVPVAGSPVCGKNIG
jgi:branched-chain amino acid transport system substrate-binding protein